MIAERDRGEVRNVLKSVARECFRAAHAADDDQDYLVIGPSGCALLFGVRMGQHHSSNKQAGRTKKASPGGIQQNVRSRIYQGPRARFGENP